MFEQYIKSEIDENLVNPEYKHLQPAKAFLGIDNIKSKYVRNKKEDVFKYILRHTFMRPRDIMEICYQLYLSDLKSCDNVEETIRKIVNVESKIILESFLSETDNFLVNVNREQLEEVCQLINYNILNRDYVKYVCKRINENFYEKQNTVESDVENFYCDKDCDFCNNIHPFYSLYNIGLLGIMWKSRTNKRSVRFSNINDRTLNNPIHCLPNAELYFLHPCFASKAEHIRKNCSKSFDFNHSIIIENNAELSKNRVESIKKNVDTHLKEIHNERIFISSTCYDLHNERAIIDEILTEIGFDVVRSDAISFNSTLNGVNSHDHCINELAKCKYVIFIVSGRYGGEYCGSEYIDEKNEIKEINPTLSKPSVSLMEYYIARKLNIETHVFVDSRVYNERLSYKHNIKYNIDYKPCFANDNRVFEIIDFITKQNKDNWFRQYNDLQNLGELVRIVFESK